MRLENPDGQVHFDTNNAENGYPVPAGMLDHLNCGNSAVHKSQSDRLAICRIIVVLPTPLGP
ncbi:MAG: hypothetical protein V7K71_03845 [Nostoc sp.]